IDKNEDMKTAAYRELEEETGIPKRLTEFIAEAPDELTYDLPDDLVGKVWGGKFRGQRQKWYLLRFTGKDDDIDIETEHPEFASWKWATPSELPDLIVPFKRELYRQLLAEFAEYLTG
ncbi:MAG: RNA pyrophosphohydrolase, partial [Sphingomonadaceae bacterium]|nr:RNA pyrophosphohydrolase [Sphingomonadaceae bacterium]